MQSGLIDSCGIIPAFCLFLQGPELEPNTAILMITIEVIHLYFLLDVMQCSAGGNLSGQWQITCKGYSLI